MKIVVLDGYTLNPGDNSWDEVAALGDLTVHERSTEDQVIERANGADIVLTNKTPLSASTLEALGDLKFISVLATGFNVVDVAKARERDIAVSNIPIYGTDSVAQFTFAHILRHCHHIKEHSDAVMDGEWARRGDFCFWDFPLIELAGLTLGIVGFGRIGRRVGELANAFGMKVIAYDPFSTTPPAYDAFEFKGIEELFTHSDFISVHSPQTEENAKFINKSLLERMKPSAVLINTSRGGLVNEQDLKEALEKGTLAAAMLDVVSAEPIREDNPIFGAKNITVTPHIAWGTLSARKRLMHTTSENIAAFLAGQPINLVN